MASFCQTMLERYADDVRISTEHPFLAAAGKHELSSDKLSEWLTQDRCYALHGYPKFIASLISALPLSSPAHQSASQSTLALLSYAMSNIHREVGFFDSLRPRFGIDLERRPTATDAGKLEGGLMRTNTRAYVSLLIATGAEASRNGGGMEEGLVLLWTMEKLYNQAWLFAAQHTASPSGTDGKTSAALTELIDNWTNAEFADFVTKCENAVDELALKEGTPEWNRAEEIFKYTLYLEQRFWPDM
ncbi:hypothetical protein JCM3775_000039 [Rhodotorula graminis]|uniref:Thiaminase-2/PQQC domain-containing protein n=1 Tax=Rhodotorula graminis (strain WP1) TaxID=578459 RepID=A0A194S2L3_RHOGW|nr:uncharacterized protein RHOBADRAFT_44283 [Rhodotorula graminis WP1]KPV74764.1 hypothetical protein RHOBADRAFT_44283 [Rhodotorula graminis WP1]